MVESLYSLVLSTVRRNLYISENDCKLLPEIIEHDIKTCNIKFSDYITNNWEYLLCNPYITFNVNVYVNKRLWRQFLYNNGHVVGNYTTYFNEDILNDMKTTLLFVEKNKETYSLRFNYKILDSVIILSDVVWHEEYIPFTNILRSEHGDYAIFNTITRSIIRDMVLYDRNCDIDDAVLSDYITMFIPQICDLLLNSDLSF